MYVATEHTIKNIYLIICDIEVHTFVLYVTHIVHKALSIFVPLHMHGSARIIEIWTIGILCTSTYVTVSAKTVPIDATEIQFIA